MPSVRMISAAVPNATDVANLRLAVNDTLANLPGLTPWATPWSVAQTEGMLTLINGIARKFYVMDESDIGGLPVAGFLLRYLPPDQQRLSIELIGIRNDSTVALTKVRLRKTAKLTITRFYQDCQAEGIPTGGGRILRGETGTATGRTATTMTDNTKNWVPNQWVGTGANAFLCKRGNSEMVITGNNNNRLTGTWTPSTPAIGPYYILPRMPFAIREFCDTWQANNPGLAPSIKVVKGREYFEWSAAPAAALAALAPVVP